MATATVTNTIRNPANGSPMAGVEVVAQLVPAAGAAYQGDLAEMFGAASKTTTNASGQWTLTLERTDTMSPTGLRYQISELDDASGFQRTSYITVPGAGPFLWANVVTSAPNVPPGVTGPAGGVGQVAVNGVSAPVEGKVNIIPTTGVTASAVDNPGQGRTDLTLGTTGLALDSAVVHNTGNETIAGTKTFSAAPVVPSASFPESATASLVSDLAATEKTANKGAASGYAPLDGTSRVPDANLPADIPYTDQANTFTAPQTATASFTAPLVDKGGAVYNVTAYANPQAAITAAAAAGGGIVQFPAGAFTLGTVGLVLAADNIRLVGAGRNATKLIYTGTGAAVAVNALGGASLRANPGLSDLTIDVTGAGAGARALEIDNTTRGNYQRLYLNATGNPNPLNVLNLIGSASKATYFNSFADVDITSGTGGNCIKIGDACNGNRWDGGVLDGNGQAIDCEPAATATDTCKFSGVFLQTGASSLVTLGGVANVSDFAFIDLRCEPVAAATFTMTSTKALRNFVWGGTFANVSFVSSASDGNLILRSDASAGLQLANYFNSVGTSAGLGIDDRTNGNAHGWFLYSSGNVGRMLSNQTGVASFTWDEPGNFLTRSGIGAWGHAAPAAQPAAPVTLADVIAIIRGCGLSA